MVQAIFKKEFLKTRYYFFVFVLLSLAFCAYFAYNLNFEFSTVEPESMMWYRFVHLEQKPYFSFVYLFLAFGVGIALAQFVPERVKNRVKLMTHLPISMQKALFLHLGIGVFLIFILSLMMGICVWFSFSNYYPTSITAILIKDFAFYTLGAFLAYLFLSATIIERSKSVAMSKFFLGVFALFVFIQERFYALDALWVGVGVLFVVLCLDSFYSIKYQRTQRRFLTLFILLSVSFLSYKSYTLYNEKYQKEFNKYYVFYSPIKEEFIYQKNFGEHRFEYGIQDKETFSQKIYESYLPFVYWRDLDIQGLLPLHVKDAVFSKNQIKESRLSFSYKPSYLQKLELDFYPLLNPQSDKGMIRFPEEMFFIAKDRFEIYDFDNELNKTLSESLHVKLDSLHVSFPIQNIWGKATNMKPYDLGYLFVDARGKLINLKRENTFLHVKEINKPNINIKHISLSENKQKNLAGYAIDESSNIYLLDWDFGFHKLEIEGFDYKTMKFQLISDPLHYTLRFDDGVVYKVALFDKNLVKLKEEVFSEGTY